MLMVTVFLAVGHYQITGPEPNSNPAGFITVGQIDSSWIKAGSIASSNMRTGLLGTMASQTATNSVLGAAARDTLNAGFNWRNLADSTYMADDVPKYFVAGAAIKFGDIVYLNRTNMRAYPAQGDSLRSSEGLGICVQRGGAAAGAYVLVSKAAVVKFTPWTTVTTDSTVAYLSASSAGTPTMVRTSTTGQWAVKIGIADTVDVLEFRPSEVQLLIP